jgi:hypothetical protein
LLRPELHGSVYKGILSDIIIYLFKEVKPSIATVCVCALLLRVAIIITQQDASHPPLKIYLFI